VAGAIAKLSAHAIDVLILGNLDRPAQSPALVQASGRHLQVGDIHIDLAARTVDVAGTMVHVSRLEFELLVKFAVDPTRVVGKHALARCIGDASTSTAAPSTATPLGCAPASLPPGLTTCSSTSGGKAGRSPPPTPGASNDRAHA
jgi:hypothetical protein